MAFVTALLLLDCPASALNMSNEPPQEAGRGEMATSVKFIKTKEGRYPYVSAQSFRYWLRTTLEETPSVEWRRAPIFRESKVAYTDANPIAYWDDDLFGYMRAPSKKKEAVEKRKKDKTRDNETPTATEITRISPFKASTFVAVSPVSIAYDFGTMSRHEGDPVPHGHQFYRTALKGLVSLDLGAAGTFSYKDRTGFRNLDDNRKEEAREKGLEEMAEEKCFRLPLAERRKRVSSLLNGLGILCGGANQTLHYTDVTPKVFVGMVTRGGNNPLQYVINGGRDGLPCVHEEALKEMADVWKDHILSKLYVGWVRGFHDHEREKLSKTLEATGIETVTGHPLPVLARLADDIRDEWFA
ncbi:MAG TPA: type I-B CRISPR-associated protein Cas7/Cst2/DevR [Deltaproteobacteria bacterium]|nr:type I-B CRISPR-associated protein Cas7/Cst2/DevR [Deltaproteobacteria bacterium]